jgi:hypothetical protein
VDLVEPLENLWDGVRVDRSEQGLWWVEGTGVKLDSKLGTK